MSQLPKSLQEKINEEAERYSEKQFDIAPSRTVATYCNSEVFADSFEQGAHFGASLVMEQCDDLVGALVIIGENDADYGPAFRIARKALSDFQEWKGKQDE